MKDKLLEIILSVLVVSFVSVMGFYLKGQIDTLKDMVTVTQEMQVELSRRGEWMTWVTLEITNLQEKTKDRYTSRDADVRGLLYLEKIQNNKEDVYEVKGALDAIKQEIKEIKVKSE